MLTIRALIATAFAAGALCTAASASASPATDALFAALNGLGYPITPQDAIMAGDLACDSTTSGIARDLIASEVADKTGLDPVQSSTFVGIAIAVYCPLR